MSFLTRFLSLFRPRALERELDDELQFHLQQRTEHYIRDGMSRVEAEQAARDKFGSVSITKQRMREVHVMNRFVAGVLVGILAAAIPAGLLKSRSGAPPSQGFYFAGENGVQTPKLIHEVKAYYSPDALQAGIAGTVLMECVVEPNGACDHIKVVKPLYPSLDDQAVKALRDWRFQPGSRAGQAVPTLVTVEIAMTCRGCGSEQSSPH
jgi:TonB family protein